MPFNCLLKRGSPVQIYLEVDILKKFWSLWSFLVVVSHRFVNEVDSFKGYVMEIFHFECFLLLWSRLDEPVLLRLGYLVNIVGEQD